jgi:NAD+ synthase (glutamine-hydrolysing)
MKIALAQIDSTIADFEGNLKKIDDAYREGTRLGAELVIFPELAVAGYPPRDLLERNSFIRNNLETIDRVVQLTSGGGPGILCGYIERNTEKGKGRPLFNAAVLCADGQVVGRAFKTLLPTYDVFDEDRYFQPARECEPIEFRGLKLGVTICEDIWSDTEIGSKKLYKRDPAGELSNKGADIILNCSASPYFEGKVTVRRDLLRDTAKRLALPVVYCNCAGANDELIFDGASMAYSPKGQRIAQAKQFAEDLILIDTESENGQLREMPEDTADEMIEAICLGIKGYLQKIGIKSVALGLSGGIDSALVAALSARALGPENVNALLMPSRYSSEGSILDAKKLAENLAINYHVVPIDPLFTVFEESLGPVFGDAPPNVAEENLQARIRGTLLMALSNKFGHLVLATGNKSELATGYCTLYGDMCGGLAPIGDLTKQNVYRLARRLNKNGEIIPEASITKPPSAELRPDQTDQDTLPPYEILDEVLERYINEQQSPERIISAGFERETVERIVMMIDRAEFKRRQAAMVLKVTTKAFGPGRRLPIARGGW